MGLRNFLDYLTCEFGPMKPQNGPKNSPIQTLNLPLFTFVKSILSTYLMGAHKDLVLDPNYFEFITGGGKDTYLHFGPFLLKFSLTYKLTK